MAKLNFKKIQDRAMSVAGLVAGSVATNYASTAIEKMAGLKADGKPKIDAKISAGILVVAAAALPSLMGGGKAKGFIEDFSNGMMAQAGYKLALALDVPGIKGIGNDWDSPISDYLPSGSVGASGGQNILSGTDN